MVKKLSAPWRITFDTNPDLCNIKCVMCEEHSIHAKPKRTSNDRIMDFEIIKKVLENTHNNGLREIIPSTMGAKIVASAVFLDFGITDAITDKHRKYPASFVIPIKKEL